MSENQATKSTTPLIESQEVLFQKVPQNKQLRLYANKSKSPTVNRFQSNHLPTLSNVNREQLQVKHNNLSYSVVKVYIINSASLISSLPSSNTFYSLYIKTSKPSLKKSNCSLIVNPIPNQDDILCSSLKELLLTLYSLLSLDTSKLWKISILNEKYKPLATDTQLFNSVAKSFHSILYAKISLLNQTKPSKIHDTNKSMLINSSFAKHFLNTKGSIFKNKELQQKVLPSELIPVLNSPFINSKNNIHKLSVRHDRLDESRPSIEEMDSNNNLENYDLSSVKSFREKKILSPYSYINRKNNNINNKNNNHMTKAIEYSTDYFHFFNKNIEDLKSKYDKKPILLHYNRENLNFNFNWKGSKKNINLNPDIDKDNFNSKNLFNNHIMKIKHIKAVKCPSYYDQYVYSTKSNNKTISKGNFRQVRLYIQNQYMNRDTHIPTQSNFSSEINHTNEDNNSDNDKEEKALKDPKTIYLQALYDFNQFCSVVFIPLIQNDDLVLMDSLTSNYIFINDLEMFPIHKVKREFLFYAILSKHVTKYHSQMINDFCSSKEYNNRTVALLANDSFIKMVQELYFLLKKLSQDIRPFLNTFKFEEKNFKISSFLFMFFGCSDDYFALDENVTLKIFNELHIDNSNLTFQQFIEFHIYIKYGIQLSIEKKVNLMQKIIPSSFYDQGSYEEEYMIKLDKCFGINDMVIKVIRNINEDREKRNKKLINLIYSKIYKYFYHSLEYLETENSLLLELS